VIGLAIPYTADPRLAGVSPGQVFEVVLDEPAAAAAAGSDLLCERSLRPGPVLYPVACAPQAWSAASVFLLLQACLGMEINGLEAQIYFTRPQLPTSLGELRIHDLEVTGATVDLLLVRHKHGVGVTVLRREGNVQIMVVT
jgi:hypothetical protein